MKKILLYHLLLVGLTSFLVWYLAFPHSLWGMEGNAFFSTIPDFTTVQLSLPADWAEYGGAYLLQFYCYRALGATFQALFAVVIVWASDWVLYRLFSNKGLLWLSFLPVLLFVGGQFSDTTLVRSFHWMGGSLLFILLIAALTLRRKPAPKGVRRFFARPYLNGLMPVLLLGWGMHSMVTAEENRVVERFNQLDYLAEGKQWDVLLQQITPADARHSAAEQRWALLALSEKSLLGEHLFKYGITDPENFYYGRQDNPFCRNFNSQFFLALGLDNEVVHHTFQAGIQAPYGMCFRSMRMLVDAWLRMKEYDLAERGVEVMRRTSCHGKWLQGRLDFLESVRSDRQAKQTQGAPFFIGAHPFLSDMARIVDSRSDHQKALEYLLCGLLLKKDLVKFYYVFDRYYPPASTLPRHYEEALLVLAMQHPEVMEKHSIDVKRSNEFGDFRALLNGKNANGQMVEMKYGDSFWAYYFK